VLITEARTGLETVLSVLASSPREAVYCLINEEDKRIAIYSTSNFISHISRLSQELSSANNREIRRDLNKVKVTILETVFRDKRHRNNLYRSIVQKYKRLGWTFYKDTNITQYKLKESYRHRNAVLYYVLTLENPKGRSIVVGVFEKARDARTFKASHYPDAEVITEVVVADNDLTKSW
jgi:hypothetical protein